MKKEKRVPRKLKLARESIQLLAAKPFGHVHGLSGGEDCSIGGGCLTGSCPRCPLT